MFRDPYAHERATFRHLVTVKTPDGLPVVCRETLGRALADDLGAKSSLFHTSPSELLAIADGLEPEAFSDEPLLLCHQIWQTYRVLVGAFDYGYQPDWLCTPPSPIWAAAGIRAFDREG